MDQVSSLYIHFPFCRHLCNYCDFYKHKLVGTAQISEFELKVLEQLDQNKIFLSKNKMEIAPLKSLYIGGGTPSLWSLSGANFINENIINKYGLEKDCEFTIEIDPGTWTPEEVDRWVEIGANRFSIGVQSFDKNFLPILDRAHTMEEAIELLDFLGSRDYNYSIDLMLGLPFSEKENRDIEKEIDALIPYKPSHFSVYILKCRSNYPHIESLPTEDYIADEYLKTCEHLSCKGFEQYEVSNFAKNKSFSRHNLKYWNYESVACLGANATGLLYNRETAVRYQWKAVGIGLTEELIEGSSLEIEKIYMKLRASKKLTIDYFKGKNREAFVKLCDAWQKKGYLLMAPEQGICLSPKGYLLLDSLMDISSEI